MKTPMEAFSGKRPDVSHFRIFGSSVYCHVTKDARKKLDPTAELGILVGYTDTPHNYRVYLPTSQRTVVRRDLKFDEQKAMRVSLERELKLHAEEELLVPKEGSLRLMRSSRMQRIQEWRHPLMQSLPEMGGNAQGKLTD
jgi:hypothetical protein